MHLNFTGGGMSHQCCRLLSAAVAAQCRSLVIPHNYNMLPVDQSTSAYWILRSFNADGPAIPTCNDGPNATKVKPVR